MSRRGFSTIPEVYQRLYERLAEVSTAEQVAWGHPGRDARNELVLVGNVNTPEQDAAAIGQRGREERYDVEVVVDVARRGGEARDAIVRAFELVREVEELVRSDTVVRPEDNGWCEVDGMDVQTSDLDGGGWQCVVICRVAVKVRI